MKVFLPFATAFVVVLVSLFGTQTCARSCFDSVTTKGLPLGGIGDGNELAEKKPPPKPTAEAPTPYTVHADALANWRLGRVGTPYVGVADTVNRVIHLAPQPILFIKKFDLHTLALSTTEVETASYAKQQVPLKYKEYMPIAEADNVGFPAAQLANIRVNGRATNCVIAHIQVNDQEAVQPSLSNRLCANAGHAAGHEILRDLAGVTAQAALGFTVYKYDPADCLAPEADRVTLPYLYFSGTSRSQNQHFYQFTQAHIMAQRAKVSDNPHPTIKFSGKMMADAAKAIYDSLVSGLGLDCAQFSRTCEAPQAPKKQKTKKFFFRSRRSDSAFAP